MDVIKTLVDRAARICEPRHIEQELQHLNQALQANGYRNPQIKRAMRPSNSKRTTKEHQLSRDWQGTAYLSYINSVTDRIGERLERQNIKAICQPTQQLRHQLPSAKNPRNPLTSTGAYRIPYSYGTSATVVCHRGSVNSFTLPHSQREAIEIYEHTGNFNRKEENLAINKMWYPVLRNAPVTRTANRTDRQRMYNGCTPDNESFNAEPLRPRQKRPEEIPTDHG
ncbi:hypothetical protein Trydic_g4755 [Trypoxylus dichotomus]